MTNTPTPRPDVEGNLREQLSAPAPFQRKEDESVQMDRATKARLWTTPQMVRDHSDLALQMIHDLANRVEKLEKIERAVRKLNMSWLRAFSHSGSIESALRELDEGEDQKSYDTPKPEAGEGTE